MQRQVQVRFCLFYEGTISKRFRQFDFFTKRLTLLVDKSRKHQVSAFTFHRQEPITCHRSKCKIVSFFCDCWSIKWKVTTRYLFKKNVVFSAFNWKYFDVNIIRFFTHFSLNQRKLESTKKEPVTSDLIKSAKKWGPRLRCFYLLRALTCCPDSSLKGWEVSMW